MRARLCQALRWLGLEQRQFAKCLLTFGRKRPVDKFCGEAMQAVWPRSMYESSLT